MNVKGYDGMRAIEMIPHGADEEEEEEWEDLVLNCSHVVSRGIVGRVALSTNLLQNSGGGDDSDPDGSGSGSGSKRFWDPLLHQCFAEHPYDTRFPPRRDGWREKPVKMFVRYAFYFVEVVKFEVLPLCFHPIFRVCF